MSGYCLHGLARKPENMIYKPNNYCRIKEVSQRIRFHNCTNLLKNLIHLPRGVAFKPRLNKKLAKQKFYKVI